jgi:hypothetical protein
MRTTEVLNRKGGIWTTVFHVVINFRCMEVAIRKDAQCLRHWKKNGEEVQMNLQRNSNGALIKMEAELSPLQATEVVTILTMVCLMADIPVIRSCRSMRGSQVLTEIRLDSSIITCHQQVEGISI